MFVIHPPLSYNYINQKDVHISKQPLLEGEFNMLKYTIRGENIEVTPAIRDYVEK